MAADRWPQSRRDATPASDFAGPHQSFPIKSAKDVKSAEHLAGHAADPAAVKAKISKIAAKKGLPEPKQPAAPKEITRAGGMARVRVGG